MSIFGPEASPLEVDISQAAIDLKITGFGQRARALLKRNRRAGSDTAVPEHVFRSAGGPDLVREVNGLILVSQFGDDFGLEITDRDQELLLGLQRCLPTAQRVVAELWRDGPPAAFAASFASEEDIPMPLCRTYPQHGN